MEGIERAAAFGAQVVEIDVRLSRDGVPVLSHDPWLWRVKRRPYVIAWSRARRLRLPTFDDALATAARVGIEVSIDVKDPRARDAVVRTVRATGAADRVHLWAREREQVEVYAREFPGSEVALLRETHDQAAHEQFLADAEAWGATAVSGNQDAAGPEFIATARERGIAVYAWYQTLDKQRQRLEPAARAGLHGAVTDWPEEALRVIAALGREA